MTLLPDFDKIHIGVVGLGYVGLPLALAFSRQFQVIGFDSNSARITELEKHQDSTEEVSAADLKDNKNLKFAQKFEELCACNIYIVTVPTPVDKHNKPDLIAIEQATNAIGRILKPKNIVIFESTVFPGATEEVCVPILESVSGLTLNSDFFVGYSPERVNPGAHGKKLTEIVKVTSGSDEASASFIEALYGRIIAAGTFSAENIKVAEAAKVIENVQRDVNIALVNELAILFEKIGIDTNAVLDAAKSKWNFMDFRPGLVGGHCIGVDPFYLTHKAAEVGHHPEVILAGRKQNDAMPKYVAERFLNELIKRTEVSSETRALVMGVSFKENCKDIRNSKAIDVVYELRKAGIQVDVYDPIVDADQVNREYGLELIKKPVQGTYSGIIVAVGHKVFLEMGAKRIRDLANIGSVIFDLKGIFGQHEADIRL